MFSSQSINTRALNSFHPSIVNPIQSSLERLQSSESYLANPSFRRKVEWAREGSSHKLILKSSTSTSNPTPEQESPPEMAILSSIVEISPSNFFMTADGNYRGPGRFNIPFSDVKLSCYGGRPPIEELVGNFNTAIDNLHWLQNEISTRGFTSKKGLLLENTEGAFIKIRHKLFEGSIKLRIYVKSMLITSIYSLWNLRRKSKRTKMTGQMTNLLRLFRKILSLMVCRYLIFNSILFFTVNCRVRMEYPKLAMHN